MIKKLLVIVAVAVLLALACGLPVAAQEEAASALVPSTALAVEVPAPGGTLGGGLHKELKIKFIEGSAFFMSWIAIAFVVGLAFCMERIIYLSLSDINTRKFVSSNASDL